MKTQAFCFCLLTFLCLNACKNLERPADEVIAHILSEPPSLHPTNERAGYKDEILGYSHQRLTVIDPDKGSIVPELAAEAPEKFEDGLRYTYTLHPKAAWPDGQKMTMDDVLFSYKVVACPYVDAAHMRGYLSSVEDLKLYPDDPTKMDMVFKEYSVTNMSLGGLAMILDPRKYDPEGVLSSFSLTDLLSMENDSTDQESALSKWAKNFNDPKYGREIELLQGGSGPYQVAEWEAEQQIRLVRNTNYWGKGLGGLLNAQKPASIVYKFIKDDKAVELQFKSQQLDVSTSLSIGTYQSLDSSDVASQNYILKVAPRESFAFLAMNNRPDGIRRKAFFSDKKVRQAIAHVVPIEEMIEEYFNSTVIRTTSAVPNGHPDHNPNLTPLAYDPEKARQLLAEAGWADSDGDQILDKVIDGTKIDFKADMLYPPNGESIKNLIARVKKECEMIGIQLNLVPEVMGVYRPQVWAHDFDMALMALGSTPLVYNFDQIFHSSNWAEGDNFMGFNNAEADALITQANLERDPDARLKIAYRIQEIMLDEQPCVFLFNPAQKMAVHKRFKDVKFYDSDPYIVLSELGE
ncbi:MAG: ABC transporter substrate-binding protein [Bacteroidota bacterium]